MKDINEKIPIIVRACDEKKGLDIRVLDIKKLTPITDYFVLVSGNSTRQVLSLAEEIVKKMEEAAYEIIGQEGKEGKRWLLLDYGDVVVHIFHKKDREFYNLDKLWMDADEISIDNII